MYVCAYVMVRGLWCVWVGSYMLQHHDVLFHLKCVDSAWITDIESLELDKQNMVCHGEQIVIA